LTQVFTYNQVTKKTYQIKPNVCKVQANE